MCPWLAGGSGAPPFSPRHYTPNQCEQGFFFHTVTYFKDNKNIKSDEINSLSPDPAQIYTVNSKVYVI